jgi:ergothioneine biosynthesis protein EgtB
MEFQWLAVSGGETAVGYTGEGFCFDNELPRHRVLLQDFEIANRLVTNAEWLEFVNDGGYEQPLLWLSDGWAWRCNKAIEKPLYWLQDEKGWQNFTLTGLKPLSVNESVTHISYYEADAYARWAGQRLPTEQEWEHSSQSLNSSGHAFSYGQRWEWTASPYTAYPDFHPRSGNVGEYNGKFMINQMVLRGASGATAEGHGRVSYRNFFYPDARWQFSSLRLVKNRL